MSALKRPIGAILDGLGVKMEIADGDFIASVVVLAKIVKADGEVVVGLETGEADTWFDQLALLNAGLEIDRSERMVVSDGDEG
jgi:hypothetical protein